LADSSERTAFDDRDEAVLQILANAASIAIDNARLFEESQTREAWLKAVAAVNARLLSGGSRDETLAELVRTTRRLTDGNLVCIVRYDLGEGPGVHVAESRTRGTTVSDGTVLDLSGTVIDEAARSRRTISAPSASAVPALHVSSEESVVALPLSGTSFGGGVLFASRRSDRPWGVDEIEQLTAMADIAAVTVEFAEQQRKERLVDVLEDRDRIARDLHDHVIQQLFATGLSLQGALQRPGDEETIRTVLDNSVDQLDRTVREIRTAVFDLHTSEMSTPTSLRRRLLDAVNGLSGHSSITPSVTFEGTIDSSVPARLAPHAEAVVREGLSNALRHAHANAIDVTIRATEDLVISIV
ncbi:MAG: histidine kinase, partial [Rhodococcus sp. (in: high G+C Gram-positive bacteria)]